MSYIDFGKELFETKNHTGAIMTVISKMGRELKVISEKLELLHQENTILTSKLENMAKLLQSNKKEKIHSMKTRRKSRKKF